MPSLRSQLPPMDTLATFEAAARLRSFTLAAKELHITQAAVSRQIKLLEESLKTQLFIRAHKSIQLTSAGMAFYSTTTLALSHIANASGELRSSPEVKSINIAADQSIAWLWLMPRIARFRESFPDIHIRLIASDNRADCIASDVDAAIAFGPDEWPGFNSQLLFEEEIFPVCSPSYQIRKNIKVNEALQHCTLLGLEDDQWGWVTWRAWMTEMSMTFSSAKQSVSFNNYPLLLQSAKNGLGLALGWKTLVDEMINNEDLVKPFDLSYRSDKGYYLLTRDVDPLKPGIMEFRDWVCREL